MNQILVTEKIYVTPELKRKKKTYKLLFMLSIFSIICLFSVYIYAEYDRNRDEKMSKSILNFFEQEDNTRVSKEENALVVLLTQDAMEDIEEIIPENNEMQLSTATSLIQLLTEKHMNQLDK